jgi:hypothetical protein
MKVAQEKSCKLMWKTKQKQTWGMDEVVEHMPTKAKPWIQSPVPRKKKKKDHTTHLLDHLKVKGLMSRQLVRTRRRSDIMGE